MTAYDCSAQGMSAAEAIYVFVPEDDYEVEVRLTDVSAEIGLFVLADCDSFMTATVGDNIMGNTVECSIPFVGTPSDHGLAFTAVAGDNMVIVVDGLQDAEGSYTLELVCTPALAINKRLRT